MSPEDQMDIYHQLYPVSLSLTMDLFCLLLSKIYIGFEKIVTLFFISVNFEFFWRRIN